MKTLLIAVLLAAPAFAEEEGAKPDGEHALSAPEVILEHVSDGEEWEFEIPLVGAPTVHLGEIFKGLKWETVPGACTLTVEGPLSAIPTLGRFINGCRDFRPTKATLMMWFATVLLLLFLLSGISRDKSKLVPKGVVANIIEVLALFVRNEIAYSAIGKKEGERFVPYLCTIFFFILFMNWLGLIPNFGSATGQLSVTLVLAVCTFFIVQVTAIRAAGIGTYLSHLTAGTPPLLWIVMIPVEVLGLFTKPFALMIRLFANMLGGHMVLLFIIGLIFILHPLVAALAVPMGVAIYLLEIFVGILQAYIFTLLTALYIGQSIEMGHHGHAAEGDHASAH
jgi:F-type H+-transporting ATPase subunit a